MHEVRHCEVCKGTAKHPDNPNEACAACNGTGHVIRLDVVPPPPDGPGGQTGQ